MDKRLQRWNQNIGLYAIHCFYILYFALGMPFICWGAVATPGHPHRLPHFVFAPPTLSPAAQHTVGTQTGSQYGMAHVHGLTAPAPTQQAPAQTPSSADQPSNVAGRSTPMASAITLLTLLFVSAWWLPCSPRLSFMVTLGDLYVRPFAPAPLTPPPR